MEECPTGLPELIAWDHRLVKREAKQRARITGNDEVDFVNRVWTVVHGLSPDRISVGHNAPLSLANVRYVADVVAVFPSFLLVVRTTQAADSAAVVRELDSIRTVKRPLEAYLEQEMGGRKLVAILVVRDQSRIQPSLVERARQLNVKVIDERDIDYYLTLLREAGIGIHQLFFTRVAPSVLQVSRRKIPAIRIREGKVVKYIFSVNPYDLLSRAFVSHRELSSREGAPIGYQRMLKRKKLVEIAKFIKKKRSFPVPIIVSFPENAGEAFEPLPQPDKATDGLEHVTLGRLRLPSRAGSVCIVDGQHRLYGYTLLQPSTDYQINVIAYKGLDPKQQGSMFLDINLNQTRVPAKLLWELYPDILSPQDDEYYRAVVASAVEKLVASHLRGIVSHISLGSKGKVTFRALCEEVVRAGLLAKGGAGLVAELEGPDWKSQENRLETILTAFFDVLGILGSEHPHVNPSFFFQASGLIPLVRELGKACRHLRLANPKALVGGKSVLQEALTPYFRPLYRHYGSLTKQQLQHLTRTRVGGSGFIETEDEMDDRIRDVFPSFPLREKRVPPTLQVEAQQFVSAMQEANRLFQNQWNEWIFREFDKDKVLKLLSRPAKTVLAFEKVVGVVFQEVVEASGAGSAQNRASLALGVDKLSEVEVIRQLSLLRNLVAHRASQVDLSRRREALAFLGELAGVPAISAIDDLHPDQCLAAQVSLTVRVRTDFLERLVDALRGGPNA